MRRFKYFFFALSRGARNTEMANEIFSLHRFSCHLMASLFVPHQVAIVTVVLLTKASKYDVLKFLLNFLQYNFLKA